MLRHGSSPNECDECADAPPQCCKMCWRNINNLAVHTGHLYMHVTEFHFADMVLSVYIDPLARIITL
jgi:hypothetical protein